jgi:hypothetical protein
MEIWVKYIVDKSSITGNAYGLNCGDIRNNLKYRLCRTSLNYLIINQFPQKHVWILKHSIISCNHPLWKPQHSDWLLGHDLQFITFGLHFISNLLVS